MAALRLRSPSGYHLGVLLIVVVALIWAASSVLVQAIFAELHFERPFFLTYVANTCFVSLLPLRVLARALRACAGRVRIQGSVPEDEQVLTGAPSAVLAPSDDNASEASSSAAAGAIQAAPPADGLRAVALSSLIVCPIWFAANFTYNVSLAHTTVTASTVISASSSAFTLLLSLLFLSERFGWLKLAGVALCWLGNALTVLDGSSGDAGSESGNTTANGFLGSSSDGGVGAVGGAGGDTYGWFNATSLALYGSSGAPPHQTLAGVLLCTLSAFLYASYTVTIRAQSQPDITLFFGLLGFFNGLLFLPVVRKYTTNITHARTHAHTHARARARACTHTHTHTCARARARGRAHAPTHTHTRTHAHTHINPRTYTHICTYTCIYLLNLHVYL